LGVEVRAVGDDDFGQEAVAAEIEQETAHMIFVVARHQGESNGEIAKRIGGQQECAMAEMQFVDAQGAGDVFQGPLTIVGHVDLPDFPIEAVVEKAVGEIEEELALERLLQAIQAHAVFEQASDR
jgi:hypothetical protein